MVERAVGQSLSTGTTEGVGLEAQSAFEIRVEHVIRLGFDGFQLTLEEHAVVIGQTYIGIDHADDVGTEGDFLLYTSLIDKFYFAGHSGFLQITGVTGAGTWTALVISRSVISPAARVRL